MSTKQINYHVTNFCKQLGISRKMLADKLPTMADVKLRYTQLVLKSTGGNKTVAAKILGVNKKTVYRRLASIGNTVSKKRQRFCGTCGKPGHNTLTCNVRWPLPVLTT